MLKTDKTLQDKLAELKNKIKANSKEARFADKLVDELLSVKGQLMTEPTLVHLPIKDIEQTLDRGHFKVYKVDADFVYATKGYKIVVSPTALKGGENSSLYEWLDAMCHLQSKVDKNEGTDAEKETLEAMLYSIDTVCNIPLSAFVDEDYVVELLKGHTSHLQRRLDEMLNSQPSKDDSKANAAFEAEVLQGEKVLEDLKK